jgi:putative ABC transport system permease protein
MFIVILGYAVSIPIVMAVVGKLFEIITAKMSATVQARLNWINIIIGFIIIIIIYELSKVFSKRKANQVSMVDALKNRVE